MKFKIGDRVKYKEDGSVGVIVAKHVSYTNCWWVQWDTGDTAGERLWSEEQYLESAEPVFYWLVFNGDCNFGLYTTKDAAMDAARKVAAHHARANSTIQEDEEGVYIVDNDWATDAFKVGKVELKC